MQKNNSVIKCINAILDTRITLVCSFGLRQAQGSPLDSETGRTGELWANHILLILKTKMIAFFFWQKKIIFKKIRFKKKNDF